MLYVSSEGDVRHDQNSCSMWVNTDNAHGDGLAFERLVGTTKIFYFRVGGILYLARLCEFKSQIWSVHSHNI